MPHSFSESISCDLNNSCPILYECIESICTHKSPYPPSAREIIGSILLIIFLGMANVGGLGGSFIASPVLMTIFNFDPIVSIRITYCTVLSGAIGNFLINSCTRRPNSRKPAIDYDAALLCIPLLVSGSSIGVIANNFLPPLVSLIALILLCLLALCKCWDKAISEYRKENFLKSKTKILALMGIVSNTLQKETPSRGYKIDFPSEETSSNDSEDKSKKYPLFPFRRYVQFLLLLLIVVVLLLLRGSKSVKSIARVEYCGGYYWMIYVFTIVVCFIFGCIALFILKKEKKHSTTDNRPEASSSKSKEFDVGKHPIWLLIVAFISGIIAGISGVGGGLILNPVFLSSGMSATVATATSGFLILFTSFISVFQTAIAGALPLVNSLYFSALSFIGALVIATILRFLMKKYKRASLLLFVLSFVTFVGAIAVSANTIYRLVTNKSAMVALGKICQ